MRGLCPLRFLPPPLPIVRWFFWPAYCTIKGQSFKRHIYKKSYVTVYCASQGTVFTSRRHTYLSMFSTSKQKLIIISYASENSGWETLCCNCTHSSSCMHCLWKCFLRHSCNGCNLSVTAVCAIAHQAQVLPGMERYGQIDQQLLVINV